MLQIDGVAVRAHPAGGPLDLVAQFDGPTERIDTASGNAEVLEVAPSLYMLSEDLGGVVHGTRVEVLEGPGVGDYEVIRVSKEEDGAFSRVDLADRI